MFLALCSQGTKPKIGDLHRLSSQVIRLCNRTSPPFASINIVRKEFKIKKYGTAIRKSSNFPLLSRDLLLLYSVCIEIL
ncbi:hypothetical protein L1987_76767 [Smallanthus sonchifolius]|uniref:Uncharacterized protein n=1 Tax=Smallanthus sonchifolius TaxID=185202 RepID=A0ACB8Z7Y1_9ASTR|nr:hypothetical protein L1987_76767 [Smallanthus sonchifolius]